jgi:hypothetical protein
MTMSEAFFSSAASAANRAFARESRVIVKALPYAHLESPWSQCSVIGRREFALGGFGTCVGIISYPVIVFQGHRLPQSDDSRSCYAAKIRFNRRGQGVFEIGAVA